MKLGLIIPVMKNFMGVAELMESVDVPLQPFIIDNWKENRGVSGGWNLGIERAQAAGCDYAIIMNDDSIFEKGTIDKLVEAIDSGAGFVVSAINRRDQIDDLPYEIRPGCDYSCFIMNPQSFFDTVGRFDENFYPAYFEDNDMERRILLSGNKPVHRTDAMHFHRGGGTQYYDPNPTVSGEMFENNRYYYIRKWGGEPLQEQFVNPFDNPDRTYKEWVKGE